MGTALSTVDISHCVATVFELEIPVSPLYPVRLDRVVLTRRLSLAVKSFIEFGDEIAWRRLRLCVANAKSLGFRAWMDIRKEWISLLPDKEVTWLLTFPTLNFTIHRLDQYTEAQERIMAWCPQKFLREQVCFHEDARYSRLGWASSRMMAGDKRYISDFTGETLRDKWTSYVYWMRTHDLGTHWKRFLKAFDFLVEVDEFEDNEGVKKAKDTYIRSLGILLELDCGKDLMDLFDKVESGKSIKDYIKNYSELGEIREGETLEDLEASLPPNTRKSVLAIKNALEIE